MPDTPDGGCKIMGVEAAFLNQPREVAWKCCSGIVQDKLYISSYIQVYQVNL